MAVNLVNLKNQAVLVYILHLLVTKDCFLIFRLQCEEVGSDTLSSVSAKKVARRCRDDLLLIVIDHRRIPLI